MAAASSIDLYEIRSSELALTRSANPRLRDFARTMISDHQGTSAQLSFAGRRLNLLPSASLLPAHQAMFDELSASSDFDATYNRQQAAVHEAALKLHSAFAARGESPTLQAVARNAAPIERRHLDMWRR
jgi:putative membrane protein